MYILLQSFLASSVVVFVEYSCFCFSECEVFLNLMPCSSDALFLYICISCLITVMQLFVNMILLFSVHSVHLLVLSQNCLFFIGFFNLILLTVCTL